MVALLCLCRGGSDNGQRGLQRKETTLSTQPGSQPKIQPSNCSLFELHSHAESQDQCKDLAAVLGCPGSRSRTRDGVCGGDHARSELSSSEQGRCPFSMSRLLGLAHLLGHTHRPHLRDLLSQELPAVRRVPMEISLFLLSCLSICSWMTSEAGGWGRICTLSQWVKEGGGV